MTSAATQHPRKIDFQEPVASDGNILLSSSGAGRLAILLGNPGNGRSNLFGSRLVITVPLGHL